MAVSAIPKILCSRSYRLFAQGQFVSGLGTWMQAAVQAWLLYKLSRSPAQLGLAAFVEKIPVFALAPVAGIVADRFSRRNTIIISQLLAMILAFTLASLTFTGRIRASEIITLTGLLGVVEAFEIPSRLAFTADIVGPDGLTSAIAINSAITHTTRIIGPGLGAWVAQEMGVGWCFIINGISYAATVLMLVSISDRCICRTQDAERHKSPTKDIWAITGLITARRDLWMPLFSTGIVSLVGMSYLILLPLFVERLHREISGLAILWTASSIGALLGALTLAYRKKTAIILPWASAALLGSGVSLILFSLSRSFPLSALLLVITGFCTVSQLIDANTSLQVAAPNQRRGSIAAVYSMFLTGLMPVGAIVAGSLARIFGPTIVVALSGTICLLAAPGVALIARGALLQRSVSS